MHGECVAPFLRYHLLHVTSDSACRVTCETRGKSCLDNRHLVRWKQGAAESGSCCLFTCLARETRHEVKSSSDVPKLVRLDSNDGGQVHSSCLFVFLIFI